MPSPGFREEITDLIDPKAYDDKANESFKVGAVIKFSQATIKITKIDRKNKRTWGVHTVLVDQKIVGQHHLHEVNRSKEAYKEYGAPYCEDCEVRIDEPSTEDGEKKALDRRDGVEDV